MKKASVAALILLLLLAMSAEAVLAEPPIAGETSALLWSMTPPDPDPWFSLEPEAPHFSCSLSWKIGDPLYSFSYYLNEQTYAALNYLVSETGGTDVLNLKGGYLWEMGFFVALDHYKLDSNEQTFLIPGYRYDFSDSGYVAASLYYRFTDYDDETAGYDISAQYRTDTMVINADLYADADYGEYLEAQANFKAADDLVWGVGLGYADSEIELFAGLTWVRDALQIEAKLGDDADGFYYALNMVYYFSARFNLGLTATDEAWDDLVMLKAIYITKAADFGLIYSYDTEEEESKVYLTYYLKI